MSEITNDIHLSQEFSQEKQENQVKCEKEEENHFNVDSLQSVEYDTETKDEVIKDNSTEVLLKKENNDKLLEEGEITGEDDEVDDDVPSDFFDDFSKEDFLEGLEIGISEEGPTTENKSEKTPRLRNKRRSPFGTRKRRRSSSSKSRSISPYENEKRRKLEKRELEMYKKSFLEEIREKLNELKSATSTRINVTQVQVPPPMTILPPPLMSLQIPVPLPLQVPPLVSRLYNQSCHTTPGPSFPKPPQEIKKKPVTDVIDEDFVTKLFTEKKISLSDYLTIIAKREVKSSSPVQLEQKIKVIKLCQDAINFMTSRSSGTLKVQRRSLKSEDSERSVKVQYQSPILKNQFKFKFTSHSKHTVDTFSHTLIEVLEKINVFNDTRNVDCLLDSVADGLSKGKSIDKEMTANILKISLLGSIKNVNGSKQMVLGKEMGTQCTINTKEMRSVITQVERSPKDTMRVRKKIEKKLMKSKNRFVYNIQNCN